MASGIVFGVALAMPMGPQNIFVLNQGVRHGAPYVFVPVVVAGLCDAVLILAASVGATAVLEGIPHAKSILIGAGALFLLYLGIKGLLTQADWGRVADAEEGPGALIAKTAGVSLLNPHAILDTIAIIGGAIAAQPAIARAGFTVGIIGGSLIWFLILGLGGTFLGRLLTSRRRVWFDRASGALLIALAVVLVMGLL